MAPKCISENQRNEQYTLHLSLYISEIKKIYENALLFNFHQLFNTIVYDLLFLSLFCFGHCCPRMFFEILPVSGAKFVFLSHDWRKQALLQVYFFRTWYLSSIKQTKYICAQKLSLARYKFLIPKSQYGTQLIS